MLSIGQDLYYTGGRNFTPRWAVIECLVGKDYAGRDKFGVRLSSGGTALITEADVYTEWDGPGRLMPCGKDVLWITLGAFKQYRLKQWGYYKDDDTRTATSA